MVEQFVLKNEEETRAFGLELAAKLTPGKVVALVGDLGTGKTALTKYIAEGLGVKEAITSPTFTIVKEYKSGRLPLYHFDVYRLDTSEDMYELGYEEYFFGQGVSIVEWADLVEEFIPEDAIVIHINYGKSESERKYHVIWG